MEQSTQLLSLLHTKLSIQTTASNPHLPVSQDDLPHSEFNRADSLACFCNETGPSNLAILTSTNRIQSSLAKTSSSRISIRSFRVLANFEIVGIG